MVRLLFLNLCFLLFISCKNETKNDDHLAPNQVIVDLKQGVSEKNLEGALKSYGFLAVERIDSSKNIWIYRYNEKKVNKERLDNYLKKSIHTDH